MTSTTAEQAEQADTAITPGTATPGTASSGAASEVELLIGGMTCASCAARVEKKLNRMDGVSATVNFATEKAKVSYGTGVEVADLIATVVKTGYTAEEPAHRGPNRRPRPRIPPGRTPNWARCATGCSSPRCSPCPSRCSR